MSVHTSQLPHPTRTLLRSAAAPFLLGVAAFVVGMVAADARVHAEDLGPSTAWSVYPALLLWTALAAGVISGVISGRGHGWLGLLCSISGMTTACLVAWAFGDSTWWAVFAAMVLWVPLAMGYVPAHVVTYRMIRRR